MQRTIKFFKKNLFIVLIIVFSIPTFIRMIKPGIYSMQDFHYFRLVEYGKCVKDLQLPCRWSASSGLGYGEPLFNYYGQASYFFGQIFRLFGFSNIASLKMLFIFSILGSGISMFILSKKVWKSNLSGLISSILYMYAPYRAVDVWVRGALPEALSFVLFPLLIYELEMWFEKKKEEYIIFFSMLLALLICTHNLSSVMFLVFLIPYLFYKLIILKKLTIKNKENKKIIIYLSLSFIFSILLSGFYIIPLIFESKFINLGLSTTTGYFDFKGHFVTLKQILFSRFWGYGASVWGEEDGLNLSIGIIQWIIPLLAIVIGYVKKSKKLGGILLFTLIGWFCLFLTHNKSTTIWQALPFMKFIQFPWRFYSVSIFAFCLASGGVIGKNKKLNVMLTVLITLVSIILTFNFFKEDIWYKVSDIDLTQGQKWEDQSRASIKDYWPIFGEKIPDEFAPKSYDNEILLIKRSNYYKYNVYSETDTSYIFPVTYFPGWKAYVNGKNIEAKPIGSYGLLSLNNVPFGKNVVELEFSNTIIRKIGDLISFISIIAVIVILIKNEKDI